MSWWYFSFKDAETREFLGGAVIEAQGPEAAQERAHGEQVQFMVEGGKLVEVKDN